MQPFWGKIFTALAVDLTAIYIPWYVLYAMIYIQWYVLYAMIYMPWYVLYAMIYIPWYVCKLKNISELAFWH